MYLHSNLFLISIVRRTDIEMKRKRNRDSACAKHNHLLTSGIRKFSELYTFGCAAPFILCKEPPAGRRKLSPSYFLPVSFTQSLRLRSRLLQNLEASKNRIDYTKKVRSA